MEIEQIYKSIDDLLLAAAGNGVKACNKILGTSRNDLANLLNGCAPVAETCGYTMGDPIVAKFVIPVSFGLSAYSIYKNQRQENAEEEALERKCKISDSYSKFNEPVGVLAGTLAVGINIPADIHNPSNMGFLIAGLGHFLRASSHYVMRTVDVPRKKSVFENAYDLLIEKIKGYFPKTSEVKVEE
jgi:hypothetical protein